MRRQTRELNPFTMSAVDLFTAALGAFIVLSIVLIPYFTKNTRIEVDIDALRAQIELLNQDLEVLQGQLAAKEEELDQLAEEASASSAESVSASAAADALMEALNEAESELENAQNELKFTGAENEALEEEIKKLKAQARAMSEELAKSKKKEGTLLVPGIDVVYVIDTTNSMGVGVDQVRSGLVGIVSVLRQMAKQVRVGFVAYKTSSRRSDYAVISKDLTDARGRGLDNLVRWVSQLSAQGGGEEVMFPAMRRAFQMAWNPNAINLIVLVADEPGEAGSLPPLVNMARAFAGPKRKIATYMPPLPLMLPISPADRNYIERQRQEAMGWLQQIAQAGNGRFVLPESGDVSSITLLTLLGDVIKQTAQR